MDINRGYVALTDPDWYDYLRQQPHLDEVNFWQPHGDNAFRALSPGETFFFKLRAPARAIAGFGFFQRYESMPASYARTASARPTAPPTSGRCSLGSTGSGEIPRLRPAPQQVTSG